MHYLKKIGLGISVCTLVFLILFSLTNSGAKSELSLDRPQQVSDHFDGSLYFNPGLPQPTPSSPGNTPSRGVFWYLWRWLVINVDLKAQLSLAAHSRVFQLGWDGFDDAVNELASSLKHHRLKQDEFVAPVLGQAIDLTRALLDPEFQRTWLSR